MVRSRSDLTIIFPTCGLRYGGSSRKKAEGIPFKMVLDKSHEATSVMKTPTITTQVKLIAASRNVLALDWVVPTMNRVIRLIIAGKRPLHGTIVLVKMAIIRSRSESIIRHPTTPAALHPSPMQSVNTCLPHVRALQNTWSRLNAMRGKYPMSSKQVKRGKKIAIGGSMTDTTDASTFHPPSISMARSHSGAPSHIIKSLSGCAHANRR